MENNMKRDDLIRRGDVLEKTVLIQTDVPTRIAPLSTEVVYVDDVKNIPAVDAGEVAWVSVKDRMPEEQQTVLAYCAEDNFCYISRMHQSFESYDVTHWIPLPEFPMDEHREEGDA